MANAFVPGEGYLRVNVTEVGGTIPIEGATVIITEYNDESGEDSAGAVLHVLRTDEGGLTQTVALPAPSSGESLRPGSAQPYSLYNVTVLYEGYYPIEGVGVPVFEGVTSLQPFNLIPNGAGSDGAGTVDHGRVMIYENPSSSSLSPGGAEREDIGNRNGLPSGMPRHSENVREAEQ